MESSEAQFESLSKQIEEREQAARRRAWLITLIPIFVAVLLLAYTIWQIARAEEKLAAKTTELQSVEGEIDVLRTQLPQAQEGISAAQSTVEAVQAYANQLQTDLSQAQTQVAEAQSALATATAQLSDTQKELDSARVFAQNACPLDETVLKDFASDYAPQVQVLLYLMDAQRSGIPWKPGGFSPTEGFNSPDFALYVLQNATGFPLVSPDIKPGTPPWKILELTPTPANGDILYYQSGYTMFYYELPSAYGSQDTMQCVIGMTPLGIISQQVQFAQNLGALNVPYPE